MKKDEIKRAIIKKDKNLIYHIFKCCIDKAKGKKDWFIYWYVALDKKNNILFDSNNYDEFEHIKQDLRISNINIKLKDFKKFSYLKRDNNGLIIF
tara:strand:+ start:331 stop:615 length:285 start_codon:yes stop_codon:yes gene_type:complete